MSKRSTTALDGSGVRSETATAAAAAIRKPGVAGWMSHIPDGPPLMYAQTEAATVPATTDAVAPQKLNLRQYSARIVIGPNAAPIPPPKGRT